MNKILHLHLATQSAVDLEKGNIYKYAEDQNFSIQLIAYSYNSDNIHIIDLAHGQKIPQQLACDILDGSVIKMSHDAQIERICLSKLLLGPGEFLSPSAWRCTQVMARYFNLSDNIDTLCQTLQIPEHLRPDDRMKYLIQRYDMPHTSEIPMDDNWQKYKDACIKQVAAEKAIWMKFVRGIATPNLWYKDLFKEYALSEKINDRGIQVDVEFAQKMSESASAFKAKQIENLGLLCDKYALTHNKPRVQNVTNGEAIRNLLDLPSMEKEQVNTYFRELPVEKQRILLLHDIITQNDQQFQYDNLVSSACSDDRIRGGFEFYGAGTGRFSSKLHSLKKDNFEDLDSTREAYQEGSAPASYHYLSDIGSLIRTALVPKKDYVFSDADYSQIETRVLAWLAGEQWMLDAFREGRDIYCEEAAQIFSTLKKSAVKVEKDGENAGLRKVGKVATLALGYGGGNKAFDRMGGAEIGFTAEQTSKIVKLYREANPNIQRLWNFVEDCAKRLIKNNQDGTLIALHQEPMTPKDMEMRYRKSPFGDNTYQLEISLPVTHRVLIYPDVRLEQVQRTSKNGKTYTQEQIVFRGRSNEKVYLYGGKLVENIVQAIARDILLNAMEKLDEAGYLVVMSIHDQLIVESKSDCSKQLTDIMASAAERYEGLPMLAEGKATAFFRKD